MEALQYWVLLEQLAFTDELDPLAQLKKNEVGIGRLRSHQELCLICFHEVYDRFDARKEFYTKLSLDYSLHVAGNGGFLSQVNESVGQHLDLSFVLRRRTRKRLGRIFHSYISYDGERLRKTHIQLLINIVGHVGEV